MSSNTTFKVYLKFKGESQGTMLAQFMDRTDAVNYAHAASVGKYYYPEMSIMVMEYGAKVLRYCRGVRV